MNLLFFKDADENIVAVNPEYVTFIETDKYKDKAITMIYFTNYKIAVLNQFDDVVSALNAWRKRT